MKPGIHPSYDDATITCACGSIVVTRSTRGSFSTDVCSACHPFYTGKQKLLDVAGRVDRFRKKYAGAAAKAAPKAAAPAAPKAEPEAEKAPEA
jgi:large subunit ribosomal protein L31